MNARSSVSSKASAEFQHHDKTKTARLQAAPFSIN
jgi:hypothetical protein